MKTMDYFKEIMNAVHIKEGPFQLSRDFNWINYSGILTKLIQEAGRWCRRYASDLFIDWGVIDRQIKDRTIQSGSYLFGFREDGVDDKLYIFHRYDADKYCQTYRAIWRLDIVVDDAAYPSSDMVAVSLDLYEVGR